MPRSSIRMHRIGANHLPYLNPADLLMHRLEAYLRTHGYKQHLHARDAMDLLENQHIHLEAAQRGRARCILDSVVDRNRNVGPLRELLWLD